MFYSYILSFSQMSFSVPGSHPGDHITFSCHVSLSSPWLWQYLKLSSLLMTLIVWRHTHMAFCKMFLIWDFPNVFLMIRPDWWVWGRKITEVKCSFHQHILKRHGKKKYNKMLTIINLSNEGLWVIFFLLSFT